jgi:hypothetical protein
MGKNILTGWIHVTVKELKILIKNRFLLLIYLSVIVALILIALFIRVYLEPEMLSYFDFSAFYPALPTYMILTVIFSVSIFLMSQGAVSFTEEDVIGTADRLRIMNMPYVTIVIGKFIFYYLSAIIMVACFNIALYLFFMSYKNQIPWDFNNFAIYILLWPLVMVVLAGLFYGLVRLLKGKKA